MDELKSSPGLEPALPAAPDMGVPRGIGHAEPEVQGIDRLHVLHKYRKLVFVTTLLGLVAGVARTCTTPTAYLATTVVRADSETMPLLAANAATGNGADAESFIQAEMSVIHGRDLKRRVVRKLRLDQNPQLSTLLRPTGVDGASAALRSSLMRAIRGTAGSPLESASGPPRPAGMVDAPRSASVPPETPGEARAIELIAANLEVRPQPASHLFTIALSAGSPQLSADIANAFASEYASENPARRRLRIQGQLKSLTETLMELNAQIEADRQTLDHTAQATTVDDDVVARNVSAAEADLRRKQSVRLAAEQKSHEMEALDPEHHLDTAQTYPDVLESTASSRQQIATLRADRVRVLNQGGRQDSALIKAIDSQVIRLEEDLTAGILRRIDVSKREYAAALSDEQTAAQILKAHQNLQARNHRAPISLEALKEDIGVNISRRDSLLAQRKALELVANGTATNVAVVEYAQPAPRPYQPRGSRNLLLSLAFGLTAGLLLAFGLDRLDDTIKTPEDITRKLHVPFLGLVPAIRGDRQPVLSGPVPHDFGEAYRALRTSLVFTSGAETTRIVTVTSAQALEGKTTTACNLALVLAFGGSRVLLIDADLRRPAVHKTLGLPNTVGLSHLLTGQARVREAIQRTNDPNLCVITSGRTPANPSELLVSERMKQLVVNLKQGPFDWVVIDTPPVLAVTDPVVLTPLVDGVTFVIGSEMTRRGVAERAVQMLMAGRPKVIGAILNRVNFERNKYYYSRYYGSQYRSDYGTEPAETTNAPA